MLNSTITIKIKQRLNKLDSQDYDNIECWQIVESFNKAQVQWARRQLHGSNIFKEGDEQSTRRKDDLQVLMKQYDLDLFPKEYYYFAELPEDYLQWKRTDVIAKKDCCDNRRMTVYFAEEANLQQLLNDKLKQPNFQWAETFATLIDNNVHIYTNKEFEVESANLIYYRQPRKIQIQNCVDPYTGVTSTTNVTCEFKDDIIEVLIDDTVSILAGDIESTTAYSIANDATEKNN
jgi:hypothetical protein